MDETSGGARAVLAWLPYADETDLTSAFAPFGGLPDGLDVDCVPDARQLPASITEVGFFVLPYLTAAAGLARAPEMTSLAVIQTLTAGYEDVIDHVPPHVRLCNASGLHDTSTAELTIGLILANLRRLDDFARQQATGEGPRSWGTSLADRRVLIVGYGRIGSAIEARLAGFEVASITRVARRPRTGGVDGPVVHGVDDLPRLLPAAEVVILIAPLTPETTGLLDADTLALLPDGALVVNVGRGGLVDTEALTAETTSGRLRAALDVTEPEPLPAGHPLRTAAGVTISPHVGGMSSALRPRADALLHDQLRRWAAGQPLENVIR